MIKEGIFHPGLLEVLGEMRHMDTLMIGDAGLPIPEGVKRIDLGWIKGSPPFHEVLKEISKVLVIEKAYFADEAKSVSPDALEKSKDILSGIPLDFMPHENLKKKSRECKAIILTGEFTGYCNVILVSGCAY